MINRLNLLLLAIALATSRAIGRCTHGCLKCSTQADCLLCDSLKGYYLSQGGCSKAILENCAVADINGVCIACSSGYRRDPSVLKCVKVPDSSVLENCSAYGEDSRCRACKAGYYLEEDECKPVEDLMDNCLEYATGDPETCVGCLPGYQLLLGTCHPISEKPNCAVYSPVGCRQCPEGYLLDRNKYLSDLFDSPREINHRSAHFFLRMVGGLETHAMMFGVCKKIEAANCVKYKSYKECLECDQGYYLSKGECRPFPAASIQHCETYASATACTECSQGYYLKDNRCLKAGGIRHCALYDGKASSTVCAECDKAFYLDGNVCSERVLSIDVNHCKRLAVSSDGCASCKAGYSLTSDILACLPSMPGCISYNASSKDSTELSCSQCSDGFYVDATLDRCIKGTVKNCRVFAPFSDNCEQCESGYYLNGSQCTKHAFVPYCTEYSGSEQNRCIDCKSGFMVFAQTNTCTPIEKIPNCRVQASASQCSECNEGYILNSSESCSLWSGDWNCRTSNGGYQCLACKDGYVLWEPTQTCQRAPFYQSRFCKALEKTDATAFKCNYCSVNAYPVVLSGGTVCLGNSPDVVPSKPTGCTELARSGASLVCSECDSNYYLNEADGLCQTTCDHTVVLLSMSFNGQTTTKGDKMRCKDIARPYCKFATQRFDVDAEEYICVECKDGHHPFVNLTGTPTLGYHSFEKILGSYTVNLFSSNVPVECNNPADVLFTPGDTATPVENCVLYTFEAGTYRCIKCKPGYTGIADDGYLQSCSAVINSCDTSVEYKGLVHPATLDYDSSYTSLQSFVSCTKCTTNRVPVIYLNADTPDTLSYKPFSTTASPPYTDGQNPNGWAMACLVLINPFFRLSPSDPFDSVPENCGFVVYQVQKPRNANIAEDFSVFCAACLPGYRPTHTLGNVTACTLIDNCDATASNTYFNRCGKCESGYTFKWDNDRRTYDTTTCVPTADAACEAFDVLADRCKYCARGYMANYDGVCDEISLPGCNLRTFMHSQIEYSATAPDIRVGAYKAFQGSGCSHCGNSYIKLKVAEEVCGVSSYLSTAELEEGTSFIPNCRNYSITEAGDLICKICADGYLVAHSFANCYAHVESFEGCRYSLDATSCHTCHDDRILAAGKCHERSIANCASYEHDAPALTCLSCYDGYYLSGNMCNEGRIANCGVYASSSECLSCVTGFKLVQLKDSVQYCYPTPPASRCSAYSNQFESRELQCDACNSGYEISSNANDFLATLCVGFRLIEHCAQYDTAASLALSSLRCAGCETGYYLSAGSCLRRANLDVNCQLYAQNKDECSLCLGRHYLSPQTKRCVPYPTGIPSCVSYSGPATCIECDETSYLSNEECVEIHSDERVAECRRYSSPGICKECNSGFALEDAACEPLVASDCLTASDPYTCTTCPSDYGLKTTDSVTNCVRLPDSNCTDAELVSPFKCSRCRQGYYINGEGVCELVATPIDNCLDYIANDECLRCAPDTILSEDGASCIHNTALRASVDDHCIDSFVANGGHCSACLPGHVFDANGNCVECEGETAELGCFACDPYDHSTCLVCRSGFYMVSYGRCLSTGDDTRYIVDATAARLSLILAAATVGLLFQ